MYPAELSQWVKESEVFPTRRVLTMSFVETLRHLRYQAGLSIDLNTLNIFRGWLYERMGRLLIRFVLSAPIPNFVDGGVYYARVSTISAALFFS